MESLIGARLVVRSAQCDRKVRVDVAWRAERRPIEPVAAITRARWRSRWSSVFVTRLSEGQYSIRWSHEWSAAANI